MTENPARSGEMPENILRNIWMFGSHRNVFGTVKQLSTPGARDFSSAISGFFQVFIVTRVKSFAARGFGLRPKMCRPLNPTAREKNFFIYLFS